MKIQAHMNDGSIRTEVIDRVRFYSKNPCTKCRKDGGCFDHGCFLPEDWGDFIDIGNREPIRVQDVKTLRILEL